MLVPHGEKATDVTVFEWLERLVIRPPVFVSQMHTVLSSSLTITPLSRLWLPETKRPASGENATELTPLWWPLKPLTHMPVVESQRLTVASEDAETTCAQSGEKDTEVTELE